MDTQQPRSGILTIPEAAILLGVSRNVAYQIASTEGALAGVPVIRVSPRRLVIPRAPLLKALGLEEPQETEVQTTLAR